MNNGSLQKNKVVFALDIGTRSVIGTVGIKQNNRFNVLCEKYLEHQERAMVDGQIHDIELVAKTVEKIKIQIEEELKIQLEGGSIAAAGRFLKTLTIKGEMKIDNEQEITEEVIRSLELIAVSKAEEEVFKNTEGRLYCVGYSVIRYYLNGYPMSNLLGHKGEKIEAKVIATFLPRSVIDSLYAVMGKVGLKVNNLTLEPIAAMEVAVPKRLRLLNIALVDVGAGTSDIAISNNSTITAYGMVPLAGDEVTEAIVQHCLVDFNTAEKIKRQLEIREKVTYTDVVGIENEMDSDEIYKVISSVIKKIAEGISNRIIELNSNKVPSAVFLVGGGAHTPKLKEEIAFSLGIPIKRIAIKDRTVVENFISNNKLGSAGITVLGIAAIALKGRGNDFINVYLNNIPISLFKSHQHNVMDVLLQAGINPNMLIAKKGKNIRFIYNGRRRIAFGSLGKNAIIKVNGERASLETKISEGAKINIKYAKDGESANPTVISQIKEVNSISVYLNNKLITVDPIVKVNDKVEMLNYNIQENDEVEVFIPENIGELKNYVLQKNIDLYCNNKFLKDQELLYEGLRLETEITEKVVESDNIEVKEENKLSNGITINVNGRKIHLSGNDEFIFVQVFNFLNVDVSQINGNIKLKLNGKNASYTDKLSDGDVIEVYWN